MRETMADAAEAPPVDVEDAAAVEAAAAEFRIAWEQAIGALAQVIVGQREVLEQVLLGLFAGGHVLLEGVPGLGKTLLVRTLAQAFALDFRRIQFTPDLMPADVTGTTVLAEEEGTRVFRFQPGPIFGQAVLADEVNRGTPKTQSALLEAMAEGHVTAGGERHALPRPFFVLATQNPIEMEGTYPLPEAQLDRFLFKIQVDPPSEDDLVEILARTTGATTAEPGTALDAAGVLRWQQFARQVPVAEPVARACARLIHSSHPGSDDAPDLVRRFVRFGASPRGAQAVLLAAKVRALTQGRLNVAFEDVRACALPALRHRVLTNFEADAEGIGAATVVEGIVGAVPDLASAS
jgi:MoxR-like ATPase